MKRAPNKERKDPAAMDVPAALAGGPSERTDGQDNIMCIATVTEKVQKASHNSAQGMNDGRDDPINNDSLVGGDNSDNAAIEVKQEVLEESEDTFNNGQQEENNGDMEKEAVTEATNVVKVTVRESGRKRVILENGEIEIKQEPEDISVEIVVRGDADDDDTSMMDAASPPSSPNQTGETAEADVADMSADDPPQVFRTTIINHIPSSSPPWKDAAALSSSWKGYNVPLQTMAQANLPLIRSRKTRPSHVVTEEPAERALNYSPAVARMGVSKSRLMDPSWIQAQLKRANICGTLESADTNRTSLPYVFKTGPTEPVTNYSPAVARMGGKPKSKLMDVSQVQAQVKNANSCGKLDPTDINISYARYKTKRAKLSAMGKVPQTVKPAEGSVLSTTDGHSGAADNASGASGIIVPGKDGLSGLMNPALKRIFSGSPNEDNSNTCATNDPPAHGKEEAGGPEGMSYSFFQDILLDKVIRAALAGTALPGLTKKWSSRKTDPAEHSAAAEKTGGGEGDGLEKSDQSGNSSNRSRSAASSVAEPSSEKLPSTNTS